MHLPRVTYPLAPQTIMKTNTWRLRRKRLQMPDFSLPTYLRTYVPTYLPTYSIRRASRFDNRRSFDSPSRLYCLPLRLATMFVIRIVRNYPNCPMARRMLSRHIAVTQWIFNLGVPSGRWIEMIDRSRCFSMRASFPSPFTRCNFWAPRALSLWCAP